MRQTADRYGRDLREVVGAEHLDLIQAAYRHVSKHAVGVMHDVHVIGDRTRIESLQEREWRTCIEHLGLAHVLEREPDLLAVRRRREVRAERDLPA